MPADRTAQERVREIPQDEREAIDAACEVMSDLGIDISPPWEGDLDDWEREKFDALVAACRAYSASAFRSAVSENNEAWQQIIDDLKLPVLLGNWSDGVNVRLSADAIRAARAYRSREADDAE